jgi:putative ABC transport system permease protein
MSQAMRRFARRIGALLHAGTLDRDVDAEMRLHVAMEAEELAHTRGLTPEEARRQALVAFGGVERYKEAHRDARGVRWLDELAQDLRYAVRGLMHAPAFSLSAVLVLALGIGASTAVFSAVDAVLLTRLPYPQDDRLVRIYQQNSPTNRWTLSTVDFRAIEEQSRAISAVGAARPKQVAVSAGREPERMATGFANSGFFRALGVRPARGRAMEPRDDVAGASPVALVGHRFATESLGGDASAVGRSITIDGVAHTVVGVLPAGVNELAGMHAEIWPVLQLEPPTRRGPFGLLVVGRLANSATLDAARRDLVGISERIFPLWQSGFQDKTARLTPVPLREAILGDAGHTLGMLAAAVALVLLIGVANVAGLMLVRATGRSREIVLRAVLGATRGRLVRLLVTESMVLAVAGAIAGIALGAIALDLLKAIGPGVPRLDGAQLDTRAVAFAAGAALFAAIIIGAYPVTLLLRRDAAPALRDGDRAVGAGRRAHAVRGAFVVAEFALALPVLAVAALLLNSFVRLQRVDPGFDPEHLIALHVALPSGLYPNDTVIAEYWARALPLVHDVPGVASVGLGEALPPTDWWEANNFDLVDRPVPPGGAQPVSPWLMIGDEYFATLGVPLLDGRLFTPSDTGTAPVVVVSRSWAEHYYPDGSVLGRQLISGGCTECPLTTIVGVVADVKYEGLSGTGDAVYGPLTEGWPRDLNLFIRTSAPPAQVVGPLRAALRSLDPGIPLNEVVTMDERVPESIAQPRHLTTLLGGFAAAAVALAAVGIFGMLSYTVSARRREIGVRMALGAPRRVVVGMIVRRGMGHAMAGAALGLVAALAGTRWLASVLFDVDATDPTTLGAVTLLLLTVALVASWLPARGAAGIDPVEAIRGE